MNRKELEMVFSLKLDLSETIRDKDEVIRAAYQAHEIERLRANEAERRITNLMDMNDDFRKRIEDLVLDNTRLKNTVNRVEKKDNE